MTTSEVLGELDCSIVPGLEGRMETVLHDGRVFDLTGMRLYVPRTARR